MVSFSGTTLQGVRILLVEDNAIIQIMVKKILESWGVTLGIAHNGREAIDIIQSRNFDLILMDLQMPEMDGLTATRTIRSWQDSYFKNLPILALTAAATSDAHQDVLAAGMNDFVVKPFQPETLFEKITRYVPVKNTLSLPLLHGFSQGDAAFREELCGHLIKSLTELQNVMTGSMTSGDDNALMEALHKHKTTLDMLEASDLQTLGQQLMNDLRKNTLTTEKQAHYQHEVSHHYQQLVSALQQSARSN